MTNKSQFSGSDEPGEGNLEDDKKEIGSRDVQLANVGCGRILGADGYWDKGVAVFDADRFLEYTNDALTARLSGLSDSVLDELKSLPTIFAYEVSTQAAARVGWITDIQRRQGSIRISFAFDPEIQPVPWKQLKKMLLELDIEEKTEVHRTHWAVKEVDLLAVLRKFKMAPEPPADPSTFQFSRQTLIKACDLLRIRGHAEFDRLLLDIGVDGIDAGRDKGSLMARGVALGEYVVSHTDERTAEGEPLGYAIVRHAAESDPTYSADDAPGDPVRTGFWSSLTRDGFKFEDGKLVSLEGSVREHQTVARPYALVPGATLTQELPTPRKPVAMQSKKSGNKPKVFIVHGRDAAPKLDVANFLLRIGLEPVILHERPNGGRTLIAKFQEESSDIVFAVVLMTPDDRGGISGGSTQPRARQNVIFELGFFIGKLGASKVCALVAGYIEKPSDFDAVVYVPYNESGSWKSELARELRHAGIPFDRDAVF